MGLGHYRLGIGLKAIQLIFKLTLQRSCLQAELIDHIAHLFQRAQQRTDKYYHYDNQDRDGTNEKAVQSVQRDTLISSN